jgi:DNA invertase Pin-like site-specific DNA recombinase
MSKRYGYIRVSTQEQNIERQIDQLQSSCDELFIEKISSAKKTRPEFTRLKRKLQAGDRLVVLDLDRAFRNTLEALQTEKALRERGVGFEILSMRVDNATPEGELMFTILAGFAQYERKCLIRRTKQGMESARARGKQIGRPFTLSPAQTLHAKSMLDDGHHPNDVARTFDCAPATLRTAIKRMQAVEERTAAQECPTPEEV